MKGEVRVFDRRWRATMMASDWRRWRVREKMEGDQKFQRVIGFKIGLKKKRREFLRKMF